MALSSKSFEVVNSQTRQQKGPVIRVEVSPGRFVKMHREDAVKGGYMAAPPPQEKSKPATEDKMKRAAEDKSLSTGREEVDVEADFTSIAGIGPATARVLKLNGITTFEALRNAGTLTFISAASRQAIEKWKDND